MGHEQNKQWGRTAGQNSILSCLWKEEIRAGRGREKEETGLKACQINALLRQFKSPKRHNPGRHIDDMNIFDYIKKHSGDHSELWSGAGIFMQAMREWKVQLVHFILVPSGHDGAGVGRRDSLASQHGYLDAVQLSGAQGAQTDTCDNEGKCPLDYASLECHVIVQFLLKALQFSVEKIATLQPENSPKIVCGS